jgi:hypothetical protein
MALELPYSMQWIMEITIALVVFLIVLLVFFSSQTQIETEINQEQPEQYRANIVMENLLSKKVSPTHLAGSNYDYRNRRGFLPIDYFVQDSNSDIEYRTRSAPPYEYCYIYHKADDEILVPGLNGEDYAFAIEPSPNVDEDKYASSSPHKVSNTECSVSAHENRAQPVEDYIRSSALLKRKDGDAQLPVRIYVYSVG